MSVGAILLIVLILLLIGAGSVLTLTRRPIGVARSEVVEDA